MTDETHNFEEMTANALSHIDDTLKKPSKKQEPVSPYKMTNELLEDGNMFDNTGAYFHFKEEFQYIGVSEQGFNNFKTNPDLYLCISRNPDKKLEINFKWAQKTPDGFVKTRGFNIDFLLDIGDEKDQKALNKKVSFSGGKNKNPASEGTYIAFVEHVTDLISESDCLEVFKDKDFGFPEIIDEDTNSDVEDEQTPQCFADYNPKVQHEALQILEHGDLFEEMQKSVALTHEGHKTTRNALLLMESSLFVDDGAHGLLGGESGGGKTDLALTCALNLPAKHVHLVSSNSPKDIFYDFESYDEDFNILVFDDILFNDELIKLCKLLTDNRVKKKVHKTVINGKAEKFELKGKYEIIITYAKELPDVELANRLFNIGVNIVDKGESKENVKYKIRDNRVINADDNMLLQGIREPIQAGVQYLIENRTPVHNPYLSIYDPVNFNNRDINHLVSMTNARTFFELNKRSQIKINEDITVTIGSFEDLSFVHDIWARDSQAQKFKLSELQKECLDLLPEMTDAEAFDYVESLNNELADADSRVYKKARLDDEPLLRSLARKLHKNPETLRHALDRFSEGNKQSLCELGLVDKIKLDEDNPKSQNFYYKIKKDGALSNSTSNYRHNLQIKFADVLKSSIVKQTIIINLLISANIVINERGGGVLEKYCTQDNVKFDVENYKSMTDFLQGFFDTLDYDKHVVKPEDVTRADMLKMFAFKDELNKQSHEKTDTLTPPPGAKICRYKKIDESPQNDESVKNKSAKYDLPFVPIVKTQFKEFLEEKHIDFEIAQYTFEYLQAHETATTQDLTNYICETVNPDDFNSDKTPLKIDVHLNRMFMSDLLEFNAPYYELTETFTELAKEEGVK